MDSEKTGRLIAALRREAGFTQNQLAQAAGVSPKTVSKWETGRGCPDISMLPILSKIFRVDIGRLIGGDLDANKKDSGNMKKTKFYICPECGNIITSSASARIVCCGRQLDSLCAKKCDDEHRPSITVTDGEYYLTLAHEMQKRHYIRFVAMLLDDRLITVRLYPEQDCELHLPAHGRGRIFICCSRDGLFELSCLR